MTQEKSIPLFIENQGIELLLETLAHENPDITKESLQLLKEMTDEELLSVNQYGEKLLDKLLENDVLGAVVRILSKLDDGVEDEREGIFVGMSLVENLLDLEPLKVANKMMHMDTLVDQL